MRIRYVNIAYAKTRGVSQAMGSDLVICLQLVQNREIY